MRQHRGGLQSILLGYEELQAGLDGLGKGRASRRDTAYGRERFVRRSVSIRPATESGVRVKKKKTLFGSHAVCFVKSSPILRRSLIAFQ